MSERWGATEAEWAHFILNLGLGKYLLPCVRNPDAKISPKSALKNLGQIPSHYNAQGFAAGIPNWTIHDSTENELEKWSKNPDYSICVRSIAVRALDCDLPDAALSEKVLAFVQDHLADLVLPLRGRTDSAKFLLAFKLQGQYDKRVIKINPENKIEFLADKQQFIAAGTHPKGAKYQWRGGLPEDIPELAPEQFEDLWAALTRAFGTAEKPGEYRERHAAGALGGLDPTLDALEEKQLILGYGNEGQAYVSCPFKAEHSKEGDKTETVYFPAGLRGYEMGHFHCLHASCEKRSDEEFIDAIGLRAALFEDLGPLPDTGAPPVKYPFFPAAEYAARPAPEWIIRDILPRAELVIIFGESGSGKSFVALDIAMAVARGAAWNGYASKPGRVAYVCAEGSGGMRNRLRAYSTHHQCDLTGLPLVVSPSAPNLLEKTEAATIVASLAPHGKIDVIFIDTLAQTTPGGDENTAEDMGKAIACCKAVHKATGALIALIHHAGKDLSKGARGWSGLRAAADAEIEISRDDPGRYVRISKQKDGEDGKQWCFKLLETNIDMDSEGNVMTSCAVEYTAGAKRVGSKKRTFKVNEQAVLKAFDELGGMEVGVGDLIKQAVNYISYDPDGRDQRRRDAQRAINSLAKIGALVLESNSVKAGEQPYQK